jgi:hypothetical protein
MTFVLGIVLYIVFKVRIGESGSMRTQSPARKRQGTNGAYLFGQLADEAPIKFKLPPHPNTNFDEDVFLRLLRGLTSLSIDEKRKIIERIADLSQGQIDGLMETFLEERERMRALSPDHWPASQRNEQNAVMEWREFENSAGHVG